MCNKVNTSTKILAIDGTFLDQSLPENINRKIQKKSADRTSTRLYRQMYQLFHNKQCI